VASTPTKELEEASEYTRRKAGRRGGWCGERPTATARKALRPKAPVLLLRRKLRSIVLGWGGRGRLGRLQTRRASERACPRSFSLYATCSITRYENIPWYSILFVRL
jgi:hypothetical protein